MARPARPVDADNEQALLLAAADAFARDGYRAASLNDILREAGWAKSSLYHYFAGKQGLHDHVVTALRARLGEGVEPPEPATLTPTDFWPAMARLLDGLAHNAAKHPQTRHLGLMYHRDDSAPNDGALAGLRTDVADWLAAVVRKGVELGQVRRDVPAELLVQLTVAVLGVLDRWALDRSLHSPAGPDAGRLSIHLVRDLIGTRGDD